MLMIAAALEDELKPAKSLCRELRKFQGEKSRLWQGIRGRDPVCFLRTGVGPGRAAESLREAIRRAKPSRVLVIGYAGALEPGLRLGCLVAVRRALQFSLDPEQPAWDRVRVDGEFELDGWESLVQAAESAGIGVRSGDTLTSSHVWGEPVHKRLLHERFGALIVDMETASLARVARAESIPLSCVRAVSDEAADSFLTPFSYDPSVGLAARARKLIDAGMLETYRAWKEHSSVAKESLSRFMAAYF